MLRAGVGLSSNPSAEEAAREAATAALAQAQVDQADAALVFFTVDHVADHQKLVATIKDTTLSALA